MRFRHSIFTNSSILCKESTHSCILAKNLLPSQRKCCCTVPIEAVNRFKEKKKVPARFDFRTELIVLFQKLLNGGDRVKENQKIELLSTIPSKKTFLTLMKMSDIDKHHFESLEEKSAVDILKILCDLSKIHPAKLLVKTQFYDKAIDILISKLLDGELSTDEKIQLLYFHGFAYEHVAAKKRIIVILNHLPDISELFLMEKCVIAETTFRCSFRLWHKHLLHIQELMEEKSDLLLTKSSLLVCLCKALRFATPTKDFQLRNITRDIPKYKDSLFCQSAINIMSLYTEMFLYEPRVFDILVNVVMVDLIEYNRTSTRGIPRVYRGSSIRHKDVNRLLWCCGRMNYAFKGNEIQEIMIYVNNNLTSFFKWPEELLRILLSLWILNYECKEIIVKSFKERTFATYEKYSWQTQGRLALLLSCIKLEAPEIDIPDYLKSLPTEFEFYVTRGVKKVKTMVGQLSRYLRLRLVEIDTPIKGLLIPGVTVHTQRSGLIHIDVLDEFTCYRNTFEPHGFMKLKIRLLKKIGVHSILVTIDDLEDIPKARKLLCQHLEAFTKPVTEE